jgi:HNH endonuclease
MAGRDLIPIAYLRECFRYDPETGELRWRDRPRSHFVSDRAWAKFQSFVGRKAGSFDPNGYGVVTLTFEGKMIRLYQHRVIWALMKGEWPSSNLDHWNGDESDNRFDNLFETSYSGNAQNRSNMKFAKGAYPDGYGWRATIRVNSEQIYLGYFATEEEAHKAYLEAKKRLHSYRPVPRD